MTESSSTSPATLWKGWKDHDMIHEGSRHSFYMSRTKKTMLTHISLVPNGPRKQLSGYED